MLGIEFTPEHPIPTLASAAADAEAAGFDAIFASHHYNNRDPFVALAAIADATETVRLGPGVANPYESHPVSLASRMATIDEYSDGRGIFGIGAGDRSTLANLGIEFDQPLRRVHETVVVARALWAGERVDHDGTFVVRDAALNYPTRSIPVYVGAQGPDMLRMAAVHGDGVLFNGAHPDDIGWAAAQIEAGLHERPDAHGDLDFAVYASVSIAPSADAAREAARPPVAFIAAGAADRVLDRHDLDPDRARQIGDAIARGDFAAAFDRVTPAMIDAFCIAGEPPTVEARVEDLFAHADSVVLAAPLGPDIETAVRMAGEALGSGHV